MLNKKVLLIEDDPNIREIIRLYFHNQQIDLIETEDGRTGLEMALSQAPDLLILDVMLPSLDGFEICREIRKASDVPIIMLTAKDEEIDRILGLELGADDYLVKPFSPRELVARMKAIFRRMGSKEKSEEEGNVIEYQDLIIDPERREVIVKGEKVAFRPKEFDLLVQLAKSPGIVFTRDQLLHQTWGYDFYGDIRTIDVHIKKIRQKLSNLQLDCIHTLWGIGYKFEVGIS